MKVTEIMTPFDLFLYCSFSTPYSAQCEAYTLAISQLFTEILKFKKCSHMT